MFYFLASLVLNLALHKILTKQFSLRCVAYIACVKVETGLNNYCQWFGNMLLGLCYTRLAQVLSLAQMTDTNVINYPVNIFFICIPNRAAERPLYDTLSMCHHYQ